MHRITEARRQILEHPLDLVFCDIRRPRGNIFELLESFGRLRFEIIFTTAYREYALDAFRVAALDYLLKPISP